MVGSQAPVLNASGSTLPVRHAFSDQPDGLRPFPLTLAIGVTAALFAAYLFAPQQVIERFVPSTPLTIEHIPNEIPPPAPQPIDDVIVPQRDALIVSPPPPYVPSPQAPVMGSLDTVPAVPFNPRGGAGIGTPQPPIVVPLPPVLTAPRIDPRHARAFQPEYPLAMIREEREGFARVSVLIGADGRVKDVRDLGASHPDFFTATQRHARLRWRFQPAPHDGQPVDQWHEMTVRFTLDD